MPDRTSEPVPFFGLERKMRDEQSATLGIRDFVLFALLGALCGYLSTQYDNPWLTMSGLAALLALILSIYWADRDHGPGITTETAAVITFFLGLVRRR